MALRFAFLLVLLVGVLFSVYGPSEQPAAGTGVVEMIDYTP